MRMHFWGIAVTAIIYFIVFTIFNQMVTVDQVSVSAVFAAFCTFILRFILNGDLVDFKWFREIITCLVCVIIIMIWKG